MIPDLTKELWEKMQLGEYAVAELFGGDIVEISKEIKVNGQKVKKHWVQERSKLLAPRADDVVIFAETNGDKYHLLDAFINDGYLTHKYLSLLVLPWAPVMYLGRLDAHYETMVAEFSTIMEKRKIPGVLFRPQYDPDLPSAILRLAKPSLEQEQPLEQEISGEE